MPLRFRGHGTLRVLLFPMQQREPSLAPTPTTPQDLFALPLGEGKRIVANEFERRYLLALMERADGSISAGARLACQDRANFRRLLKKHGIR